MGPKTVTSPESFSVSLYTRAERLYGINWCKSKSFGFSSGITVRSRDSGSTSKRWRCGDGSKYDTVSLRFSKSRLIGVRDSIIELDLFWASVFNGDVNVKEELLDIWGGGGGDAIWGCNIDKAKVEEGLFMVEEDIRIELSWVWAWFLKDFISGEIGSCEFDIGRCGAKENCCLRCDIGSCCCKCDNGEKCGLMVDKTSSKFGVSSFDFDSWRRWQYAFIEGYVPW